MPWAMDYHPDGAYVRFSGRTTGEDIIHANTQFYSHAYKSGPRFAVFDFSEIEQFEVDRTAIERAAAQDLVAAAAALPVLAVAIVAPQLISYGMSRMWEMQVAETGWQTKVTRSRREAFVWLEHQGISTDRFTALQD
jgi:hypothetical protein